MIPMSLILTTTSLFDISQHPKSGEVIELTDCNLAASHNTDKFNVYWPSGGGDGSKM